MEIDWSEAPDWAEWVGATTSGFVWAAESGYMFFNTNVLHKWGVTRYSTDVHVVEKRPAAWTGEGLPPVGTDCEWFECKLTGWQRVTVLAYRGDAAWIEPAGKPSMIVHNPANFRPIRTPEQIAAEEREKAVSEMAVIALAGDNELITKVWLERLHDAGYRRVQS